MSDMLVKLYDLPDDRSFTAEQAKQGVTIRKPIGPEKHLLLDWARETFFDEWASELDMALSGWPATCFIAVHEEKPVGFACYDATALGFFGPLGVVETHQGRGIGRALLLACLLDMKQKGYGYAIIGYAGPSDFYQKVAGAVEIPDSEPGIYRTWVRRKQG